jgi:hypothetical protein
MAIEMLKCGHDLDKQTARNKALKGRTKRFSEVSARFCPAKTPKWLEIFDAPAVNNP